jgi:hypothetical protein
MTLSRRAEATIGLGSGWAKSRLRQDQEEVEPDLTTQAWGNTAEGWLVAFRGGDDGIEVDMLRVPETLCAPETLCVPETEHGAVHQTLTQMLRCGHEGVT